MAMTLTLADIEGALAPDGLVCRGAFHPREDDAVPPLPDGAAVGTLVLVGNVGRSLWPAFAGERGQWAATHPLDSWAREVTARVAATLGAEPLFPFGGPPWLPFQRWARRAEAVHQSPIGPLIHPDYGLWHAYRGALAFAEALALPPRDSRPSPCETCAERPCLTTCPVDAFTEAGYDVPACVEHIASLAGRDCLDLGCRARRACPVGREHVYEPAQAAFHMAAFLRANRRD